MTNRFRLGIVLRLREMAEENARIELGHALDGHQRAINAVQSAQGLAGREQAYLSELQRGQNEAGEFQAAVSALDAAQRGIVVAQEKLSRATDVLFQARRALAEATRQREVVERLRDRFMDAEKREAERRDALAMAEIASTQHAVRAARQRS